MQQVPPSHHERKDMSNKMRRFIKNGESSLAVLRLSETPNWTFRVAQVEQHILLKINSCSCGKLIQWEGN